MAPQKKPGAGEDEPVSHQSDQQLSDPAAMTRQVSGEHDKASADESPTEPDASTENQPT